MKKLLCLLLCLTLAVSLGGAAVAAELEVVEKDGESYVRLQDLLAAVGLAGKEEARYGWLGEFDEAAASSDSVNLSSGEMVLEDAQILFWEGSAIQNSGSSEIVVRDSYIRGDTEASTEPLAGNPGNLLVGGNIRTTLALSQGQSYYINSSIVSRNWAALSTDGAVPATEEGQNELSLFSYGSYAEVTDGGYGAYSDLFCQLYAYGSHFRAAEIGIISGTYGAVTVGSIADGEANERLAPRLGEEDKAARSDKSLGSIIEGGRNAIMLHSVNLPPYWAYEGYSQAELPLYATEVTVKDSVLRTDLSLDQGIEYEPQKQAYIDHTMGSVILIKSTNINMSVENSRIEADPRGTGYIIHSVYNNDTMFMNAVPEGEQYPGIRIALKDMELAGDIAHEDYQRDMYISLAAVNYEGAANQYDCAHWNEAGAAEGFEAYCLDAQYSTPHGLYVGLSDGSVWTVTGESRLSGLVIEEGSELIGELCVNGERVEALPGQYSGEIVITP